jgi:DNA-directed RNA polymerase specialized sigma24 family protein
VCRPPTAGSSESALADGALLTACRRGDEQAFGTLFSRDHAALRALARCWPGAAHEAERDVVVAWEAVLRGHADVAPAAVERPTVQAAPRPASLRARVGRAVVEAAVARTRAPLETAPSQIVDAERFFGDVHELWPGEWTDPPRPWGALAARRLEQADMPRLLERRLRELPIAQRAVVTLHDVHGWPLVECSGVLRRSVVEASGLLRAGRESLRAALEAEVDVR